MDSETVGYTTSRGTVEVHSLNGSELANAYWYTNYIHAIHYYKLYSHNYKANLDWIKKIAL